MAKISFNTPPPKPEPMTAPAAGETPVSDPIDIPVTKVVVEGPETPQQSVVVVHEPKPVAVAGPQASVPVAAGVQGEVTMQDIKLPRLNLTQKVGGLADTFHPGSIIFEKQVVLSDGKDPVDLTPIQLRKQYQKKVTWGEGDGEQPEVYDTAEEVIANGGSLEYGDENFFSPIAHIQFAIKLPATAVEAGEELEDAMSAIDLFPYEFADERYALALWTVGSSAYTALAKPILTMSTSLLRNGLYTGHFHVGSEIRKNARNSWYAPRVKFAGKHAPEAAEFFKSIAGL